MRGWSSKRRRHATLRDARAQEEDGYRALGGRERRAGRGEDQDQHRASFSVPDPADAHDARGVIVGPMSDQRHVVIAGGGIAGLEAMMALRSLAGERVAL